MRRRNWTVPYALFLIIFVVMPLLLIVVYAFTDAEGAFTFANFRKFMMHPESINTFVYSIGIAVITTLVCLLLGYPADRKSTRLNSSHRSLSRMPSSA